MDGLFLNILSVSLTTSAVILVVIMLGSLINKRYAAKWKYWLWIVLALRLIVPFNYRLPDVQLQIQIPAEVGTMEMSDVLGLETPDAEEPFWESQTPGIPEAGSQDFNIPSGQEDSPEETWVSITLMQALGYIWIAGTVLLLLWQITGFFYYKHSILKRGRQVKNPVLLEQLSELSRELGVRRNITFMVYKGADSPMVIGLWNPVLVLPKEKYTQNESYYILRHELIHMKRRDVLIKFLLLLARDLHWFNPIIYLMHREAVVDMELACDEAVVKGRSFKQREAYTETLLSTLHSWNHKGALLTTQFSGGKQVMKKRFRNILSKSNKKNGIILLAVILVMTAIIGTTVGLIMEQPSEALAEGGGTDMPASDTVTLTIDTQLLQYLDMTYAQFKEQVGTEAEFYHGLYFLAPIPGMDADAVFQGIYDEETAGSVLSDDDRSFRVESSLNHIINGITGEMTPGEFTEMLAANAGFSYEMYPEIQEGLTGYYVAYHYVMMNLDSDGDGVPDIQLKIALDESDHITSDAVTWIDRYEIPLDSVQNNIIENSDEGLSEQETELLNYGIHDNVHNIYRGSIGNKEIQMMITRTGEDLSAAYVTRDGEDVVFRGGLKTDTAGFILATESGDHLDGTISADADGFITVSGTGKIAGNEVVFTLRPMGFLSMGDDIDNYYSASGYDAEAAEQFAEEIKASVGDRETFAGMILYPISIEIDGSNMLIENEAEMLDVYDRLMEQNGFREQIENIYTKFMFANYGGICIEDGILWIDTDQSGDYKIIGINPPS